MFKNLIGISHNRVCSYVKKKIRCLFFCVYVGGKQGTLLWGKQVRDEPQRSPGPASPLLQSLSKARHEKDASVNTASHSHR